MSTITLDELEAANSSSFDPACFTNSSSNSTSFEDDSSCLQAVPIDVTKITVLSIITILTVIGNVCVILAIFCRQMKMTRMYYFILHLSLADLLTAVFTLLPEIIWTSTMPYFHGGDFVCKSIKFLQMTGPYLSSYVLIMTAIDRFQAICHPLSNCTWTPRRSNVMISIAWIISFLLCLPQPFIFRGEDRDCRAQFPPDWGMKAYVTWFAFSNFFVPFIFLIFCYGRICHAIWDNFNSKTGGGGDKARVESVQVRVRRAAARLALCRRRSGGSAKKTGQVRMRWRSSKAVQRQATIDSNDTDADQGRHAAILVEPPSSPPAANSPTTEQITSFGQAAAAAARRSSRQIGRGRRRSSSPDSSGSPTPPPALPACSANSASAASATLNPRTHSVRGISRAKIKTVKLTVVVILGYIVCSAPFICVQLWMVWGDPSEAVLNSLNWLFWLLTLNSVVNPWIYMFFNTNLVESLYRACCPRLLLLQSYDRPARPRLSSQPASNPARLASGYCPPNGGGLVGLVTNPMDHHHKARPRCNSGASSTEFTQVAASVLATAASSESLRSSASALSVNGRGGRVVIVEADSNGSVSCLGPVA